MSKLKFIQGLSIRKKLVAIILMISCLIIIITISFVAYWNISRLKTEIQSNLVLNAQLVGNYCVVPLTFGDNQHATDALSRLQYIKSIEKAALYDRAGNFFAGYPDTVNENSLLLLPGHQNIVYEDGYFYLTEPVLFQGEMLGTISLKANSDSLTDLKRSLLLVLSLLALVLVILSLVLAGRMQRLISQPIIQLKNHIDKLADNQDFSAHLTRLYDDEIGSLYDGFNNLLDQITLRQNERAMAKKALIESEIKFRSVFENSPLGKSMTGMDGSLKVNGAFSNMLGYTEKELQAIKWQEITHPDDLEESTRVVQSLLDGEISNVRYEKRYKHKNGHFVWTEVGTTLFRDGDAKPLYFITTINDITERIKAENEIRKLNENL
ncbi:MAG: PAS domain S-box protein, partial [Bacteroidota bacterium]